MRLSKWLGLSFLLLSIPITCLIPPAQAQTGPTAKGIPAARKLQVAETYGKLPLSFEANQGQIAPQVQFLSRGNGYSLFLTSTEAVLALREPQKTEDRSQNSEENGAVLRMKLVGGNPASQSTGLEVLPGKSNYFIGNDPEQWLTEVPNYGKVRYEEVYPGVDLIYYGNQRQLEYDFVVAPGADPRAIRLRFKGADKLTIDGQGELLLQTAAGELRWHKPFIYQEAQGRKEGIVGGYVLRGEHQVGFAVSAYDASKPLIIDPTLVYSTYLGGSASEFAASIAVDSAGNAYVTGETASTNFPTTSPFQAASGGGGSDAFVAKLNSSGSALIYSTYLGGSSSDTGWGIAVDSSGSAYVVGNTGSTNFPTASPFQAALGGSLDAFVAKLNASGSALIYSTYLGGSSDEFGFGIAVDSAGNVYVTGRTASTNFPTASALQPANGGSNDAFVAKLNPSGSALVYSTYLGGSGTDQGRSIAVDSSGYAYMTGYTNSTNFPTASPFQAASGGVDEAFVAKLNASGSALVYSTYLGGSSNDFGQGIAVNSAGNAYVSGVTSSTNFPTASPLQGAFGGASDAFVTKLNASGSALVYSTYLGGSGSESGGEGIHVAVDSAGNAYVTGSTQSINFPTANAFQASIAGSTEAFVAKLDASGSALLLSSYLGGSSADNGNAIAVDASGNVYVVGETVSTNFPTVGPLQPAYGGGQDAFVAKIGAPSVVTPPAVVSGIPHCAPGDEAPISGSTGIQGVLDSTNRDSTKGVAWPATAASVFLDMDTGEVTFFDSTGTQITGTPSIPNPAFLPGLSPPDPLANGLHLISVHLEAGKQVAFLTETSGLQPPITLLSCQDVVLDGGSSLSWGFTVGGPGAVPASFLGGSASNTTSEGFGPRAGTLPAVGSLYPAIGGGGGKGGAGREGGRGGPAFVIAAGTRIRLDGTIFASGVNATGTTAGAQGGAGGSVRLGSVLIEGTGSINTAAGADSDGVVNNAAAGPVAIQAFLQDLFTGSTTPTATVSRSNAVVAPCPNPSTSDPLGRLFLQCAPENVPKIDIVSIGGSAPDCTGGGVLSTNSGSLTTPDAELLPASSAVSVPVCVATQNVPVGTQLTFRGVGADGSVSQPSPVAVGSGGLASATLTLNPNTTYQIVVYAASEFNLARIDSGPAGQALYALAGKDRVASEVQPWQALLSQGVGGQAVVKKEESSSPVEKWARAFGVAPQARKELAQLHRDDEELR